MPYVTSETNVKDAGGVSAYVHTLAGFGRKNSDVLAILRCSVEVSGLHGFFDLRARA